MTRSLDGARALVTGAASGIGRASATALADAGADVAVADVDEDGLAETAATIEAAGRQAVALPTDVRDDDAVAAMVADAVDALGGLDVVHSNAGLGRQIPIHEMPTEAYRQMMDVNCDGMFFTTREALPHLMESEGTLLFTGSMAGQYPRPKHPMYAATKYWTRGFALSVLGAYGDRGVGVTVLNPTEARTEFGSEDGAPLSEELGPDEGMEPETVGEAVVFAASQDPPNAAVSIDIYDRGKLSHF
ncbi:MAG: SDR family oxidoreductase [Halobacteriaceae archaeon]